MVLSHRRVAMRSSGDERRVTRANVPSGARRAVGGSGGAAVSTRASSRRNHV